MSKKLSIIVGGLGGEYTVGKLTGEQAFYWEDQYDEEIDLEKHITDPDPESEEEDTYIGYWNEKDDVIHSYGASEKNLKISIKFGSDDLREFTSLNDFEDIIETHDITYEGLDQQFPYLICYACERGTFFEAEVEIDDDAVFDIKDFKLVTNEIFGERFVTSVQYKGEELEDSGGSTIGKYFDCRITYPADELDNMEA